VNLSAQEALRAVAKKCENMDDVVSVVSRREKTKTNENKLVELIINIKFKDNEDLKKEILAAFEKDKGMADQETVSKAGGKLVSLHYRFGGEFYTYSEDTVGNISFAAVAKFQ
jgi:hypothetical protein